MLQFSCMHPYLPISYLCVTVQYVLQVWQSNNHKCVLQDAWNHYERDSTEASKLRMNIVVYKEHVRQRFPNFMLVTLKQQTVCAPGPYHGFAATTAHTVMLRFLVSFQYRRIDSPPQYYRYVEWTLEVLWL